MPVQISWPELQPLAARIAVGELDGDPAIDAIVEAIVARELAAAGGAADEVTVRRQAILAVRSDRVMMAMLRPVASVAIDAPAHREHTESHRSAAPARRGRPAKTRGAVDDGDAERVPAFDDGEGFARAQRARGTATAGAVGGVLIGAVVAWWLFFREGPCEHLARQACLELSEPCSSVEVEKLLAANSIDAARCDAVREAGQAAANSAGEGKRPHAYLVAVSAALGFDPRTGEPPPLPAAAAPPPPPVTLARGLPNLRNLVVDEAFIYLGSDDAVLRLRSIGGQFETIAPARMPTDIVPTVDFVYWRAKEADGSASLWVDRKRGEYPPQALVVTPAKPTVSRCIQGVCAFVDGTDGAVWTVAQDGTPAKKLGVAQTPAPTELWLDDKEIVVVVGGPQGSIAALPIAGGSARVLAGAEADPRELVGDADALFWVAQGAVRRIARAGGDVATLLPSGGTALALDATRLFVAQGPAGAVVTLPREGGTATPLVSGQPGIGRIAVDASALYWERGGELIRQPK